MKKSKVLMFADFIIFIIAAYMILQIVDIVTYIVAMSEYESLPIGEIVSYFSGIITYLFYIGILALGCSIYRRKINNKTLINNDSSIKSDVSTKSESIPTKDEMKTEGSFNYTKTTETKVETPKKIENISNSTNFSNKSNENIENTIPVVKPVVKSEPSRFSWDDTDSESPEKITNNTLSKEEEKEIVRTLSKAVENYNKHRDDDDLEKQLLAAIEKHNAKPKTPSMKMTKDELIKYAVKNDIVINEDWTKAEILDTINKKRKKNTKSSSKKK